MKFRVAQPHGLSNAQSPFRVTDDTGHGSVVSTHHYLHFIEPIRTAASERFAKHYGELVAPLPHPTRRRR